MKRDGQRGKLSGGQEREGREVKRDGQRGKLSGGQEREGREVKREGQRGKEVVTQRFKES